MLNDSWTLKKLYVVQFLAVGQPIEVTTRSLPGSYWTSTSQLLLRISVVLGSFLTDALEKPKKAQSKRSSWGYDISITKSEDVALIVSSVEFTKLLINATEQILDKAWYFACFLSHIFKNIEAKVMATYYYHNDGVNKRNVVSVDVPVSFDGCQDPLESKAAHLTSVQTFFCHSTALKVSLATTEMTHYIF